MSDHLADDQELEEIDLPENAGRWTIAKARARKALGTEGFIHPAIIETYLPEEVDDE